MGSQIPSHHTDVATAMGTGDSFLCDGGGKRLKFEKLFIQPTPLKVCTCNCAKSSKTAATSPMIKPPKNCAFSLCATSRRTGKCLRLSGNRRPIHLPSCSVNVLHTQNSGQYLSMRWAIRWLLHSWLPMSRISVPLNHSLRKLRRCLYCESSTPKND